MALKIRLRKQGRKNSPFFRLVVTDTRSKRDGRYNEALGWYNPVETDDDKALLVKGDRVQHWLDNGAEITENAEKLVQRAAPEVIKWKREKELAQRAKLAAKQRARRKAKVKA